MAIYNFTTNVAQPINVGRTSSMEIEGTFDGATFTITLPDGSTAIRTPDTAAAVFEIGPHDVIVTPTGGGGSMDVNVIVHSSGYNLKYPS